MREPPIDLPDESLHAGLRQHYGLAVTELTFLPIGHDSMAWVYRVQADEGTSYFLKVRQRVANPSSLLVPRYLHDHGVAHVVAPLPTGAGTMWAETQGYALILYPFRMGRTGMDQGMTPSQWVAYGAVLRQVHDTAVAPDLAQVMRQENYVPVGAGMVRDLEAHIGERSFDDPMSREAAAFWRQRREQIRTLAARAEELGRRLAQSAPPFVLCHADIHTNNILLDTGGQLWIVDWDETMLAPKERDLMFVLGGGISRELVRPDDEELFLRGYGAVAADALALSYYRYAWAVSDIGEYGLQVFLRPDLGAVSRQSARDILMGLFRPGEIVALAFASDDHMT